MGKHGAVLAKRASPRANGIFAIISLWTTGIMRKVSSVELQAAMHVRGENIKLEGTNVVAATEGKGVAIQQPSRARTNISHSRGRRGRLRQSP